MRRKAMCGAAVVWAALACGSGATCLHAQDELVDLVVGLLTDADKDVRALALEQVRSDVPGEAATRKFAELLPTLPADAQAGLLGALAARKDKVAAPAVKRLLESTESDVVKAAAIEALGTLGGPGDLSALIDLLLKAPAEQRTAARRSLVIMQGVDASTAIAELMQASPTPQRIALIEILAERRARNTIGALQAAAVDKDSQVRGAAVAALGQLADTNDLPGLLDAVLAAERGRERDAAEKAVMLVCQRTADGADPSAPLLAAINGRSEEDQRQLTP
ncbi:MAG: HEAT repeat domain-containing protein, partial [Planctomycetales bacterium]|nr:HEAT repeat domain-containing protein [Planctomycetales bacterium]